METLKSQELEEEFERLKNTLSESGIDIRDASIDKVVYHFEDALDAKYKETHGVVYTPEWLADGMVEIALTDWLTQKGIETNGTTNPDALYVLLNQIKICDPCVGAGVFEISLLNSLMRLHKDCLVRLGRYRGDLKIAEDIVANCIYGIDLDNNAVEITRFRLWAYLVNLGFNGKIDDMKHNIFCGDALDSCFEGLRTSYDFELTGVSSTVKSAHIDNWKDKFQSYIKTPKNTMPYYKAKANLINEALSISSEESGREIAFDYSVAMAKNTKKNKQFLWYADFSEVFNKRRDSGEPGFDIVIGNPPYVIMNRASDVFKDNVGDTFDSTESGGSLYTYFYQLGYDLINHFGIVSFVTPYNWERSTRDQQFRQKFLFNKLNFLRVVEFRNSVLLFRNAYACVGVYCLSKIRHPNIKCTTLGCSYTTSDAFLSAVESSMEKVKTQWIDRDCIIFNQEAIELKRALSKFRTLGSVIGADNVRTGAAFKDDVGEDLEKVSVLHPEMIDLWGFEWTSRKSMQILPERAAKLRETYEKYYVVQEFAEHLECAYIEGLVPISSLTVLMCDSPWVQAYMNSDIVTLLINSLYYTSSIRSYSRTTHYKSKQAITNLPVPTEILEKLDGLSVQYNKCRTDDLLKEIEDTIISGLGLTGGQIDTLNKIQNLV